VNWQICGFPEHSIVVQNLHSLATNPCGLLVCFGTSVVEVLNLVVFHLLEFDRCFDLWSFFWCFNCSWSMSFSWLNFLRMWIWHVMGHNSFKMNTYIHIYIYMRCGCLANHPSLATIILKREGCKARMIKPSFVFCPLRTLHNKELKQKEWTRKSM
jgi:hypothetical protein